LEATKNEESLDAVSSTIRIPVAIISIRTMYMKTAPNTAPATAPPSDGSSLDPIIVWLLDCRTGVSMHASQTCGAVIICHSQSRLRRQSWECDSRGDERTLNRAPMTERMTMANMDTTMLNHISISRPPGFEDRHVYHVHAFMAETNGFTIVAVGWAGARRSRSVFGGELPWWLSASFDEECASSSRLAKNRVRA
jgi:hypothetical protein